MVPPAGPSERPRQERRPSEKPRATTSINPASGMPLSQSITGVMNSPSARSGDTSDRLPT